MKAAQKNGWFPTHIDLKTQKMTVFTWKYLTKYILKTFFGENITLKKIWIKALWSYTFSKFWKSYMPPAAQIRAPV
jgi:hypothetical protein